MERDAVKLCKALGYDVNSVEFAVKDDVPYAIDFMNPVPDADVHTVGAEHFEWLVERVAELEARWAALLGAEAATPEKKKAGGKKNAAKTAAEKKAKAAAPRLGLKKRAAKKAKMETKPVAAESAAAAEDVEAIAATAAAVEAASPLEETRSEAVGESELKAIAATEDEEIVE